MTSTTIIEGSREQAAPDPRRWAALVLLAAADFVTVLDATIVNIALPSIGRDLHASTATLSWVINAYVLAFGGLLLLGGRLADLLGRRRIFVAGLLVFGLASLVGGLSSSPGMLIAARGVQGLGAAMLAPAALSLVTSLFPAGTERNKALGIWGSVAGSGAAVGVLLGGILTSGLGWQWVLFINVPITLAAAAITPRLISQSRSAGSSRHLDTAGALSVTGAAVVGVYALVTANTTGWASAQTIGLLAAAAVLAAAFVLTESRVRTPLVALNTFKNRHLRAANLTMLATGAVIVGLFFFLSLYLQQVLHYSALTAGLSQLPLAGLLIVAAAGSGTLVEKTGIKPVLLAGLLLLGGGMGWLSRVPVAGSYPTDVLGPSLLIGAGLGLAFVPLTIGAVTGVDERRYGLASGLINTSQQIGGALGLAVLTAVADSQTGHASSLSALTGGYRMALLAGTGITVLALIAAAALTPGRPRRCTPGHPNVGAAPSKPGRSSGARLNPAPANGPYQRRQQRPARTHTPSDR
jgi:EmrB/QacA subfamily drug resistance transporter